MPVLGIVALVAGLLLVVADAYARRSRNREQQASLERENQGLAARLASVESQFHQALVMMDARGLIRRINPAAESLFGYAESELLGHNILRLLPFAPSARNPIASPVASKGEEGAEMEVRSKDGSMVKVRMTGARSESQGPSDFYMFFEAPHAAAPPVSSSQPAFAQLERIVGRIGNKFAESLSTIHGYSELAWHGATAESHLRPHLEEIIAASEQASHLARNLLAFSGSQLIPLEPVDLNAVAQYMADQLLEPIELDLPGETPLAIANRECLQQVIRLLAESAVIRKGGRAGAIRVHTSRSVLEAPRAMYSGEAPAGVYGVIAISDHGTLLDAEVLAHMFEPMYPDSTLPSMELWPIYGIITSLGGRLRVESDDASGTIFEIWLPVAVEQSGTEGSRSRSAVANGIDS
jgi:two-component system, cell cycle sensor histidine kinase and response regulator CckA